MTSLSIMGVFCEDIRVEAGNVFTLVGLLPDNVNVSRPSTKTDTQNNALVGQDNKLLTKLCTYVRAAFDPEDPIKSINLRLILPNEKIIPLGGDANVIERAKAQAKEKGHPLAGVNMRGTISPVPVLEAGILKLEALIDGEPRLIAFLNVKHVGDTTFASASEQPS